MNAPTSSPLTAKPGAAEDKSEPTGRASAAYKKAFWDNIRHPGNPAVRNVLEEGTDANGGYLVPIEFEYTLVQALNENNIMRTIGCKVITTQNERKIPVANGHTQAAWTAANGAYTESNPTFGQTSIDAFKLTDLIKVSDELLSDSFFDIESYISEEFGRAFGESRGGCLYQWRNPERADGYRQTDRTVHSLQCGRGSVRRDGCLCYGDHR